MKTGNKIRSIRLLKGYSQEYMALKLNLSQSAYGKIERGESDITLSRLEQISFVLDMTPVDVLLFDKEVLLKKEAPAPAAAIKE